MDVILKERGWAGHYCCATRCKFRRNTLITLVNDRGDVQAEAVVSTVGLLKLSHDSEFKEIGAGTYFETRAFWALKDCPRYRDADHSKEISFNSPGGIDIVDADDRANDMHDAVVEEIAGALMAGVLMEGN